ncbi:CRP/FNR family transcriptional regulator, nitrogen fixation regulation protein [Bradyrhizobium sp. Ghvi]|uniref:helix-turn-helix domain-containing protein n=1 Tax=Bradyrhizobium sp. Ghvi TaxID=1855319 RepID=UPI0008F08F26|nr:helix-turn-helix domain-containing protein [Bradyrhizobium sp. Ghvi]SFQ21916.1 CRP/FNR family transcriptional regulator, nitrogen fixation regulation protein [Bradyrhizobium sp. Ghvi]
MVLRTGNADHRTTTSGLLAGFVGERVPASHFKYRKGVEIFGEDDEAEYVYQIQSGAVRTYKMLPDGRRQINSFHLPDDMFGFENGPIHRFSAEAVIETTVCIIKRCSLVDEMAAREGGARDLIGLVTSNLQHAENHMLLLGRKTALERVVAFVHEMDERQHRPAVIRLPMNRRDIADYLGLTLETVSRALSTLRDDNILRFHDSTQRQVELLNRNRIAELNA